MLRRETIQYHFLSMNYEDFLFYQKKMNFYTIEMFAAGIFHTLIFQDNKQTHSKMGISIKHSPLQQ